MAPHGVFILLLFFNYLCQICTEEICPTKCQCVRSAVRCLHQDLTTVPKAPEEAHTLDIRFNNINNITFGVFSNLHRLRSLLLNDNKLRELRSGAFRGLRRLKYLYLYRNNIRHIDADVFQEMDDLEQLYLHVNDIHEIEPSTFSFLPQLERLYLHNNRLEHIPVGSFTGVPKLKKLRIDSNSLVCDCSMMWFVEMISEHIDMTVAATCYAPDTLSGTELASMTIADFHCQYPEIEREPQDVIVDFGEDAMFSCVVSGEPAPDIIWLRNSTTIPLDKSRYEVMNNGTLMVHGADETDIGVFECMAKNAAGEVRSKPAKMIIQNKSTDNGEPVSIISPTKQQVKFNEPYVMFDCIAKGNPKPHLVWFYNNERILLNNRIQIANNGSIVIKNIKTTDAGIYSCQAENIKGKHNASAMLEVLSAPTFTIFSKNKTVSYGEQVEFRCAAKSVPKPTIRWFKNSRLLKTTENIILSDDNKHLLILEATNDDDGIYHCRAENSEGIIQMSIRLQVKEYEIIEPKIILKPEDTNAVKGTSIQMPCEFESEPPASIEWRKDGSRIIPNENITISLIGSLIIKNVTVTDTGRYECSVFNEYGRDTASVFLFVKDNILPGDEYVNVAIIEAIKDVDQAIENTVQNLLNKNEKSDIHDLFRIIRFPKAPAREIARAAEIYERTLDKVKKLVQAGQNVSSVEAFNYQNILSNEHLEVIARLSGCTAHREQKDCTDMCFHGKYRSIDGSCNNFENPMWGASLTGFRRILFPVYTNGFSQPVGWNRDFKYNGFVLPSARLVSTSIITTTDISEDEEITHMAMQWGQWLDHDLDHGLPSVSSETWDGVDCKKTCAYAAPCFPIDVPENDPRIKNRRCIDFIRTSSVCGSGMTSVLFGTIQPREQINQLTSFLDASQVYGFDKTVAQDLRDLTNDNGLLRVGAIFPKKKPLLPTIGINGMDCRRNLEESSRNCFVAGDIRANEQIGLAAMHTIWMREHNRIATQLKKINPFWDGEKIYQESRKIVGAEMQFITYEHWLPIILGENGFKEMGKYKEYNSNLNPSISNVFATAALRFGHSMINPILHRYDENFEPIPQGHLLLRHAFFSPWRIVEEGGVDPLLRGMFTTPAKLKTPTQNLNSELTEKLFHTAHAVALDLAAINIQRGRDHGLPSYTKYRQFCNMTEVNNFEDLNNEISDQNVLAKLKELYGSVHNIDVWVGGILEDQLEDGKVGPLFKCLLIEQFKRLRDGDRFWYENPATFKLEQLNQIKKTSLARILCDNGDNIDTIGENVFLLPELQDGLTSCADLPSLDLRYWADCESCNDESLNRAKRQIVSYVKSNKEFFENIEYAKKIDMLTKRIEMLEENVF